MNLAREQRARLNPEGLSLTDVMAGRGGIERGMLVIYQRRRGAAIWGRAKCWAVLLVAGLGLVVALWAGWSAR